MDIATQINAVGRVFRNYADAIAGLLIILQKEAHVFGISPQFPFKELQGGNLIQICIGQHDLQLNFDNRVKFSISSRVKIMTDNVNTDSYKNIANNLCKFLGHAIKRSLSNELKSILLEFDVGSIEIFDDSENCESFTVTIDGKVIVV